MVSLECFVFHIKFPTFSYSEKTAFEIKIAKFTLFYVIDNGKYLLSFTLKLGSFDERKLLN